MKKKRKVILILVLIIIVVGLIVYGVSKMKENNKGSQITNEMKEKSTTVQGEDMTAETKFNDIKGGTQAVGK